MSTTLRRYRPCQQCGNRCKATPIELLIHIQEAAWSWRLLWLCPICRRAQLDLLLSGDLRSAKATVA